MLDFRMTFCSVPQKNLAHTRCNACAARILAPPLEKNNFFYIFFYTKRPDNYRDAFCFSELN